MTMSQVFYYLCLFLTFLSPISSAFKVPSTSLHAREIFSNNDELLYKSLNPANAVFHSSYKLIVYATKNEDRAVATQIVTDQQESNDKQVTFALIAAAFAFSGLLALTMGPAQGIEFISGYVLELSLSVDNLIVFLLLFKFFKVDKPSQDKVLSYGLIGAVVLRGIFIGLGTVALAKFKQILLLFAGVLAFSSFKILFSGQDDDDEEDLSESLIVKFATKFFPTTNTPDGNKFFTESNGVRYATPLFLCLVCVELSDILFAFDSVPAIFGVTQNPFIVFSSNIFAIAGLRSLFAVVSALVGDLKYLEKAVGVVLAVIAAKLVGESFNIELLDPLQSLAVVLGILGVGVGASLLEKDVAE